MHNGIILRSSAVFGRVLVQFRVGWAERIRRKPAMSLHQTPAHIDIGTVLTLQLGGAPGGEGKGEESPPTLHH